MPVAVDQQNCANCYFCRSMPRTIPRSGSMSEAPRILTTMVCAFAAPSPLAAQPDVDTPWRQVHSDWWCGQWLDVAGSGPKGAQFGLLAGSGVGTDTSIVYADLPQCSLFVVFIEQVSHDDGGDQMLRVELSSDNGATYGSPINLTGTAAGAAVLLNGVVYISGAGSNGANKVVAGSLTGASSNLVETVVTGVINALRFSPSAGNFDSGSISIYGV